MKVRIQNDSPNSMSLVFKGPDVRVERLEPCTDCVEFHGTGPDACPEKGPIGEYVMQPGSYDVVVKAADDAGVTPFRGTWELTPATSSTAASTSSRRTGRVRRSSARSTSTPTCTSRASIAG